MPARLLHCSLIGSLLLLCSCSEDKNHVWDRFVTDGYAPMYSKDPSLKEVNYLPARAAGNAGKIYPYGDFVLQEERDSGLHIISYLDPTHPRRTGFIRIPGIRGATVKGGYLYTNNYDDLVTIALNSFSDLKETSRVKKVWHVNDYPPFSDTYFECVDSTKGVVIGWKKARLDHPKCRR